MTREQQLIKDCRLFREIIQTLLNLDPDQITTVEDGQVSLFEMWRANAQSALERMRERDAQPDNQEEKK